MTLKSLTSIKLQPFLRVTIKRLLTRGRGRKVIGIFAFEALDSDEQELDGEETRATARVR
jgi:hypothetical protein